MSETLHPCHFSFLKPPPANCIEKGDCLNPSYECCSNSAQKASSPLNSVKLGPALDKAIRIDPSGVCATAITHVMENDHSTKLLTTYSKNAETH